MRRPGNRSVAHRSLGLESLERRQPLAGNVTAELVGTTLLLTGDPLGNQLVVASATGGRIAVLGQGTTINSQASFTTAKAVTGIVANLDAGNDAIGFGNDVAAFAAQLSVLLDNPIPPFDPVPVQAALDLVTGGVATFAVPGGIIVRMGDGNDLVGVNGTVGGSVVANLGSALPGATDGNGIVFGDPRAITTTNNGVGGAVSVVGGPRNDRLVIYGTAVRGGVTAVLGDGRNVLTAVGASVAAVAFSSGTGNDEVGVAATNVRFGVSIATGGGVDLVAINTGPGNPATVGGSIVVATGTENDTVVIDNQAVGGAVSVATGAGDDSILLGNCSVGKGVTLNLGAGQDAATLIGAKVTGSLTVVGGPGDDNVQMSGCGVGQDMVIDVGAGDDVVGMVGNRTRFGLSVSLGLGNDRLTVFVAEAAWAVFLGGPGVNGLQIDTLSQTGIRRLSEYRFATVTVV